MDLEKIGLPGKHNVMHWECIMNGILLNGIKSLYVNNLAFQSKRDVEFVRSDSDIWQWCVISL